MSKEQIENGTIYYFGCMSDAGHHLYSPSGKSGRDSLCIYDLPKPLYPSIDTGYCSKDKAEGSYYYTKDSVGFSIISIWDNSIDSRPGSHATFLTTPIMSHDELLAAAKKTWPKIFGRMRASLIRKTERRRPKSWEQ